MNDPTEKMITIFDVSEDRRLIKHSEIKLPHAADNIEYDDKTGEILIGTIPDVKAILNKKFSDPNIVVPGGVAIAAPSGGGWSVRNILAHDGTKLSQISAAARYGSTVFLGSPFSEGLLVCSDVQF